LRNFLRDLLSIDGGESKRGGDIFLAIFFGAKKTAAKETAAL